MNTTLEPQFGYRRSQKINEFTGALETDLLNVLTALSEVRLETPSGWVGYFWVRKAEASKIYISGTKCGSINLIGADVLRTSGTTWGEHGTITDQGTDWVSVSGLSLEASDRIRIETLLPPLAFLHTAEDKIDVDAFYLT